MFDSHLFSFIGLRRLCLYQRIPPVDSCCMIQFGMLGLQTLEIFFVVPGEYAIRSEQHVDLFECTATALGVKGPGGENGEDVDGSEQV